ncbi:STAM-binding protein-like [Onychomys torridus]|uniref:STAM-binding protein-like n=1 Tax=Onychomys torridus TaxID=38674 RepID=UPI00167F3E82|nr:STAM-binding protein-like [Onychomys torridus]
MKKVVWGPQESTDEITPSTSSYAHCWETKIVEIPVPNSKGLRPVVLPQDLWDQFLHSAKNNTQKGIETCGVLCGILVKEEYHITHLIIPLQTGETDYCHAEHEEEILFLQEELGLLTLGWIHEKIQGIVGLVKRGVPLEGLIMTYKKPKESSMGKESCIMKSKEKFQVSK